GVSSVVVFVDNNQEGTAGYGGSRPDVCAVYSARPGCPNVGGSYNLSTSSLSSGSHTLKIVATDSAGNSGSNQVTFTVSVQPTVWIDAPVANATLSGTVAISGCAIESTSAAGPNAVNSVTVLVDGTQAGTATYGGLRPDVCAVYAGRAGCPKVGWSYSLNTAALAAGSHTLKIVATDSAGNSGSSQIAFTAGQS